MQKMKMVRPTGALDFSNYNNLPQDETKQLGKENQCEVFENVSLAAASEWLSIHRKECGEPLIPWVRQRFGLTNKEAIDALSRGRALQVARAM